jgi:hypothetical protein
MEKEKLHDRVYISKKNRNAYPLTEDGSAIDIDNPLTVIQMKKYKLVGSNNQFDIYDLRITKYK